MITGADLAGFTPAYEDTARATFRDMTVHKTRAWGQGPVLLQQLPLLDAYPDEEIDVSTEAGVHLAVEAGKLAYADREAWYGDAIEPPLDALLHPDYVRDRRKLIGDEASLELRPGSPNGQPPRLPTAPLAHCDATSGAGSVSPLWTPVVSTRGDTCHLDVVDRWGNMISATPSGGWLQSSPVIPELGFPLGSRLQMCWLEEGLPASLMPGRRPRTTLSPTLVYREGCRSGMRYAGGRRPGPVAARVPARVPHRGLNLQQAIDAPTWQSNAMPSSFYPRGVQPGELVVEDRFGPDVLDSLRRRGHRVVVAPGWTLGRLSAVSHDPATGVVRAGADARGRQAYAIGR